MVSIPQKVLGRDVTESRRNCRFLLSNFVPGSSSDDVHGRATPRGHGHGGRLRHSAATPNSGLRSAGLRAARACGPGLPREVQAARALPAVWGPDWLLSFDGREVLQRLLVASWYIHRPSIHRPQSCALKAVVYAIQLHRACKRTFELLS